MCSTDVIRVPNEIQHGVDIKSSCVDMIGFIPKEVDLHYELGENLLFLTTSDPVFTTNPQ